MSGFVIVYGVCINCRTPIAFNPNFVPSIRVNGEREPVCRGCVEIFNITRMRHGLEPQAVHPDAYKPLPEGEL